MNLQKQYDKNFEYITAQIEFYKKYPDVTRKIMYSFLDSIQQHIGKGKKILDPSCGFGLDVEKFTEREWEAYGNDISEQMFEEAKSKSYMTISDFKNMDYKEGMFTTLFSRYGLDYSNSLIPVLKEWNRVLAKNGRILITINNPEFFEEKPLFTRINGLNYHVIDLFDRATTVIKPKYKLKDFSQAINLSGLETSVAHYGKEVYEKFHVNAEKHPSDYIFMVLKKKEDSKYYPLPKIT